METRLNEKLGFGIQTTFDFAVGNVVPPAVANLDSEAGVDNIEQLRQAILDNLKQNKGFHIHNF